MSVPIYCLTKFIGLLPLPLAQQDLEGKKTCISVSLGIQLWEWISFIFCVRPVEGHCVPKAVPVLLNSWQREKSSSRVQARCWRCWEREEQSGNGKAEGLVVSRQLGLLTGATLLYMTLGETTQWNKPITQSTWQKAFFKTSLSVNTIPLYRYWWWEHHIAYWMWSGVFFWVNSTYYKLHSGSRKGSFQIQLAIGIRQFCIPRFNQPQTENTEKEKFRKVKS